MKKFAYVFILLFGFIVTFGVFSNFNESYFNTLEELTINYQDLSGKEGVIINLYLKEQDITVNQVKDKLLQIGENYNIDIIMDLKYEDRFKREVTSKYIYSKDFNFEDYFYLDNGMTVNFSDQNSDNYISSDSLNGEEYAGIKFLSKKYTTGNAYPVLNFMPLHTVEKYYSGDQNFLGISFFYGKELTMDGITEIIIQAFPFISDSNIYDLTLQEDLKLQEEKGIDLSDVLAPILLLIILLISTSYINSNLKEISIRKMQGNQSAIIFKRLMKTFIFFSVLAYIFSISFSYFILGGDFTSISLNVLKQLSLNAGIFLMIMSFFSLLSYFYVKYVASFVALKRSSVNMPMVYGNLLVKTILILLILSPLVNEIAKGYTGFERVYYYSMNHKESPYNFTLSPALSSDGAINGIDDEGMNFNRILFEDLIKNNKGLYADFSSAYFLPESLEGFKSMGLSIPYPSISVDYQYLKDYEIKNEYGEVINLEELKENTVFVPVILKNEKYETYNSITLSIPNIHYFSYDKPFLDPDITSEKMHIQDPVINYIVDYIDMVEPVYRSAFYSSYEEIIEVLAKNQVEGYYDIENYDIAYNYYMQSYSRDFFVSIGFLIIFSIIPIIFLYQSLTFHLNEKKKEIALKYSMGISFFSRYKELIILHLVPYIAIIISVWTALNIDKMIATSLIIYFVVIDLLFMAWIFNRFEKKSIAMILKGE